VKSEEEFTDSSFVMRDHVLVECGIGGPQPAADAGRQFSLMGIDAERIISR
jgi:hypothetical protein